MSKLGVLDKHVAAVAPTVSEVGVFIDSVAGKVRTPADVAGRLLEEVVELSLAAGLATADIYSHVTDALHNQSLKASQNLGRTIFPSQLVGEQVELGEECADVGLVLKDLCHVAGVDPSREEALKWGKFTQKQFRVSPSGTLYAVKPHIKG